MPAKFFMLGISLVLRSACQAANTSALSYRELQQFIFRAGGPSRALGSRWRGRVGQELFRRHPQEQVRPWAAGQRGLHRKFQRYVMRWM